MLNLSKRKYLQTIRTQTVYEIYRKYVAAISLIVQWLCILWTAFVVLSILKAAAEGGIGGLLLGLMNIVSPDGLLGPAALFVVNVISRESAMLLADIGDSIIEANSRTSDGTK